MAPTPALRLAFIMAAVVSVTAKFVLVSPGDDVTLQCRGPGISNITVIVWSRPDLESDGYVFFFRGNRSNERYHHDLFIGRVQLKDPGLKDGDVSVMLKDVTVNDTGRYECDVLGDGATSKHTVYLQVTEVIVIATPGDDVTLQCLGPRVTSNTVIMWTRPDLESEGHVFFFRGNRLYERYQHPLFRGRVQLKDPGLKDGDVSVILKDVTVKDTGTYRCEVFGDGGKFKSSVDLQVIHPEVVVSAKPGDDVTLHCGAPGVSNITVIIWSRSDLKSGDYVFFFRGNRPYKAYQHPLFSDRVQLKDPGLKDGDVSVILKNVTVNDTGTYMCQVFGDAARHRKREAPVQSSVYLKVTPGRHHLPLVAAASVGLVVLAGVGLLVFSRKRDQRAAQRTEEKE